MRSVAAILIGLLLLALIATVVVLLVSIGTDRGRSPDLTRDDHVVQVQKELVEAVRSLNGSVRDLAARLDRIEPRTATPVATGPKPAPVAGPDAKAIVKLTQAVERLEETLRTQPPVRDAAPVAALRPIMETQQDREPENLKDRFKTRKAACQAMRFKTYGQVLRELGQPNWINTNGGVVKWDYPYGTVSFIDGYVVEVHLD